MRRSSVSTFLAEQHKFWAVQIVLNLRPELTTEPHKKVTYLPDVKFQHPSATSHFWRLVPGLTLTYDLFIGMGESTLDFQQNLPHNKQWVHLTTAQNPLNDFHTKKKFAKLGPGLWMP